MLLRYAHQQDTEKTHAQAEHQICCLAHDFAADKSVSAVLLPREKIL
jgi:hypothetical protein